MKAHVLILALTALTIGPATAQEAQQAPAGQAPAASAGAAPAADAMNVTDPQQFAEMAASSNMFEIESSNLALEMSESPETRDFAEQMVQDHTMAGEEMMTAAESQGGITLPTALDARHQEMLDQLNGLSGEDFDQQYATMQLNAHQEAVALFTSFSQNGTDGALKDFAAKTLPKLQEHLDRVNQMVTQ